MPLTESSFSSEQTNKAPDEPYKDDKYKVHTTPDTLEGPYIMNAIGQAIKVSKQVVVTTDQTLKTPRETPREESKQTDRMHLLDNLKESQIQIGNYDTVSGDQSARRICDQIKDPYCDSKAAGALAFASPVIDNNSSSILLNTNSSMIAASAVIKQENNSNLRNQQDQQSSDEINSSVNFKTSNSVDGAVSLSRGKN